jgi:hypothetical protein
MVISVWSDIGFSTYLPLRWSCQAMASISSAVFSVWAGVAGVPIQWLKLLE